MRAGKLSRARSRLYRSRFWQPNSRRKLSSRSTQGTTFYSSPISSFNICLSTNYGKKFKESERLPNVAKQKLLLNDIEIIINIAEFWNLTSYRNLAKPKFAQFLRKVRKRIGRQQGLCREASLPTACLQG